MLVTWVENGLTIGVHVMGLGGANSRPQCPVTSESAARMLFFFLLLPEQKPQNTHSHWNAGRKSQNKKITPIPFSLPASLWKIKRFAQLVLYLLKCKADTLPLAYLSSPFLTIFNFYVFIYSFRALNRLSSC